jgi:site-specific DNA-methyltransferase (adenine-specific)
MRDKMKKIKKESDVANNTNNKTTHTLIIGDSRQLNLLQDKTAHLIITSPPYWQLKDYGAKNQIGFHEDYENHINGLMKYDKQQ